MLNILMLSVMLNFPFLSIVMLNVLILSPLKAQSLLPYSNIFGQGLVAYMSGAQF